MDIFGVRQQVVPVNHITESPKARKRYSGIFSIDRTEELKAEAEGATASRPKKS